MWKTYPHLTFDSRFVQSNIYFHILVAQCLYFYIIIGWKNDWNCAANRFLVFSQKRKCGSKIKSRKEIKDKRRSPAFERRCCCFLSCCHPAVASFPPHLWNKISQKKTLKQTQKGVSLWFVFMHVAQRSSCHSAMCIARAHKRSQTSLIRRINSAQSSTGAAQSDAGIVVSFFFLKCAVEILKAAPRLWTAGCV